MLKKNIILLFISIISAQNYISFDSPNGDEDFIIGPENDIPVIAANLKPEVQPSWGNTDFMNLLNELQIESLRWPGAEASNVFDWHEGRILPCYKFTQNNGWLSNSCPDFGSQYGYAEEWNYCRENININNILNLTGNCTDPINPRAMQIEFFNSEVEMIDGSTGFDWQNDNNYNSSLVNNNWFDLQNYYNLNYQLDFNQNNSLINNFPILIEGQQKIKNYNSNKPEEYWSNFNQNLNKTPFFVLNVYNPEYIHPYQANFDDDCNIIQQEETEQYDPVNLNHGIIRNSILEQLDIIYNETGGQEVFIQLGNEPWHHFDYAETLFPCPRAYVQKMIEIAALIKGYHPLSPRDENGNLVWPLFRTNAKIAINGDVHTHLVYGDFCKEYDNPHDNQINNNVGSCDDYEWNDYISFNQIDDVDGNQSYDDWSCEAENLLWDCQWDEEKRCEWNTAIHKVFENTYYFPVDWETTGGTPIQIFDLIDAIAIHKYHGAPNIKMLCNESTDESNNCYFNDENIGPVTNVSVNVRDDIPWGITQYSTAINNIHNWGNNFLGPGGWEPNPLDLYKLEQVVKWLHTQTDIQLSEWAGEWQNNLIPAGETPINLTDSPGLYQSLQGGYDNNFDVWVTEYDFMIDGGGNHFTGTWPHAMSFLYQTLRFMEIPNIELLSPNNLIGIQGEYRMIDTYSWESGSSATQNSSGNYPIACQYDFSPNNCNQLCHHEYVSLSPKGEALKLLNEIIHGENSNRISKINFESFTHDQIIFNNIEVDVIKRNYDGKKFQIDDLHIWNFPDASNGSLLFMNISASPYTLLFEESTDLNWKSLSSNNLYAKNYFYSGGVHNTEANSPELAIHQTAINWQFANSDIPIGEMNKNGIIENGGNHIENYFSATASLVHNSGSGQISNEFPGGKFIDIPPFSVVQIIMDYNNNNSDANFDIDNDGLVNVVDIIVLVEVVINHSNPSLIYDLNNDGFVNVTDIVSLVWEIIDFDGE